MKKLIITVVIVAATAGIVAKRCETSSPAPDEQLVSRIEDVCKIARDHVKRPNDGVTALGRYLAAHAGDMYKHLVDTVALVVQITDDDELEARGQLARKRWGAAAEACSEDWIAFADAVARDPEASERIERFQVRFDRTIEIIFSGTSLRDMPHALKRYLTSLPLAR